MSRIKGYSGLQIALHWGVFLLLVASFFSSDAMKSAWRGLFEGRDHYGTVAAAHVWIGVSVLVLATIRLVVRMKRGAPDLPAGGNPVLDRVAKVTHAGLYLLLLLMPVAGIAAWFGRVELAADAHELLFKLGMLLSALHVVGALYHQFVLKDGLMMRMKRPG